MDGVRVRLRLGGAVETQYLCCFDVVNMCISLKDNLLSVVGARVQVSQHKRNAMFVVFPSE